jgi:hypothetical protein
MNTGFAPPYNRTMIPITLGAANSAGRECLVSGLLL